MTEEITKLPALRLSVSKLKTYESCHKKYHFSYVLKMPRKDFEHFVFGKFCHKILENFHNILLEGTTEASNIVMGRSYKDALAEYKEKLTPEMKVEGKAIATQYLLKTSQEKQQGTAPTVLGVEKTFATPIGDKVLLNGMIDKVTLDADNILHVADYKTTKDKKYLKDDFLQLLTYAWVLFQEDTTVEKIRGSYILLRHNFEAITTEFSRDKIMAVGDQYVKYAEQIMAETEFAANPGWSCKWCEFLEHCPEGSQRVNPKSVNGEIKW